jgi:2-C-methyl-D-erythritol 2,4-cyclodiphosphate synthase
VTQNLKILIVQVCDKLNELSFSIVNVDVTIVLEKPKLFPYINTIKESVASLLRIPVDQTNIKATTSETMGFVGRGEGIICYATVLIQKT